MYQSYSVNIWKLYVIQFFASFHLFSGVLIPFFMLWGGLSLTQVFFLQTWFLVCSVFLEVPTGIIADRFGRKTSLALAAACAAVAALVYSSSPSFPVFFFGEFLFALAMALQSGADHALLYDSLQTDGATKDTTRVIGRYESIGLVAMAVSAPIGSLLGSLYGPRYAMMAFSIPTSIAFLVALTLIEPPSIKKVSESKRLIDIVVNASKTFTGRRKIQWISFDLAVVHALSFLMIWLYQPLLLNLGIPLVWFGVIHTGLAVAQAVAMQGYGLIKSTAGRNATLALTAVLPAVSYLVLGMTTLLPIVIASTVIITGLGLSRQPLVSEELNRMIPNEQRATVLSYVALLGRLIRALVSPLVGILADRSLSLVFVSIGSILLGFSIIRILVLRRYGQRYIAEKG